MQGGMLDTADEVIDRKNQDIGVDSDFLLIEKMLLSAIYE